MVWHAIDTAKTSSRHQSDFFASMAPTATVQFVPADETRHEASLSAPCAMLLILLMPVFYP